MIKITILFYMFFASFVYSDIYSGNIHDDIDTNVSMSFDNSFANTPTDQNKNFDDFNKTTTLSKDNAGTDKVNDLNLSNTSSIKQLTDGLKNVSPSKANAIIMKMSKSDPDLSRYSEDDLQNLSIDNIKGVYVSSKRINAVQKTQDTITTFLNTFGSQSTIKCYIKRNLTPSFYCPLVGKDRSYFTGGVANTSEDDAKSECGDYCKTPEHCLPKDIQGFTNSDPVINVNTTAPTYKTISISDKQMLKSVEIVLNSISSKEHIFLSITALSDGKTIPVIDNYDVQLNGSIQSVLLPVTLKDFTNMTVHLFKPFTYALNQKHKILATQSNAVTLKEIKLHYKGDKYWFCPPKQFVKNRNYCTKGSLISTIVGGSPVLLCISSGDKLREKFFGGYYSQESCENQCYYELDCVPTYRHLASGLTSSIYNVDYGCMSGNDNSSCTKDLCKQKIFDNIIPNHELVYYNDSQKEITVNDGQPIEGTFRPIYNISAEMNTNGNAQEKKKLMTSISKDMAYRSMMANSTYVISAKTLGETYPVETHATKIGGNGVSIEYVPQSDLFNTGSNSYTYFITANYYNYNEEDLGVQDMNGSTAINTFRSTNYTLINSSGNLKLFYIYDKKDILNGSIFEPYVSSKKLIKMVGSNGELATYDPSQLADYTLSQTYTSSKYRYNYLISNAYYDKASHFDGTSIKSQKTVAGKIIKKYNGTATDTGGTFYDYKVFIITSATRLTYQNIIDKIENGNIHMAYSNSFSKSYTKPIKGHANSNFDGKAIKIFILGKSNNMSAIGEFVPEFDDEGKEAFVFNFLYKEK